MNGKVKEFWETEEWKKYFTQPTTPTYQPPKIDVAKIQQGALGPLREEYKAAVPAIGSRLAKMGMGRSGRRYAEEGKLLRDYLTRAGAVTSDVALRGAQLELEAAKWGLTADQYKQKLEFEKVRWLRESDLREREFEKKWGLAEREFELEADKFGWTQEEFQQRIDFEKERFNRTLSSEDRRFDKEMELKWRQQDLNEQEIADKKEMFYVQLEQYQDQFDRELSFKETESLRDYELKLKDQGLTQQQIDNEMFQFNKELEFQQSRFDRTFDFEQTKWMDEFALATEQALFDNKLSRDQFKETIRQFDKSLQESGDIERSRMDLQERLESEQRRLQRELEEGRITTAEMENETRRLQIDNEFKLENGWTDEDGVEHLGRRDLEIMKIDMMSNEIFGYFDEGYSLKDAPPKYAEPPEFDEFGNPIPTKEWNLYMDQHYHPGALDLKEWSIRIDSLLGLRGVSNVDPETRMEQIKTEASEHEKWIQDHLTDTSSGVRAEIARRQALLDALEAEWLELNTGGS